MKKFLFSFAVLLCLQTPAVVFSQSFPGYFALAAAASIDKDAGIAELKMLNTKAYRHFVASFSNATAVRAFMEGENLFVSSLVDNIRTRILYNRKGCEVYRLGYFTAEHLPAEIMQFVAEEFRGYAALHGWEISTAEGAAFVVNIGYNNERKTVRIADGRFDVIDRFSVCE